jgi:effector-binding domain-containing protein
MKVKTIYPISFLYFATETTLSELEKFIPVSQKLLAEAGKLGLTLAGPVHWHYKDFMNDETKPFHLEIALPVTHLPAEYDGEFHTKRSRQFNCVAATHEGGWMEIPTTYEKIMQYMTENTLQPSGENRELYIQADFTNPAANITEIQMGIMEA